MIQNSRRTSSGCEEVVPFGQFVVTPACLICVANQGLVGLRSTRVLDGYQIASDADSFRSRMRPSLLGVDSHAGQSP